MVDKFNITANIPKEITDNFYFELKKIYKGSWEDFNALILYLGMFQCIQVWSLSAFALSGMDKKKIIDTVELLSIDFLDKLPNLKEKEFDNFDIEKVLNRLKDILS